MNMNIHINRQVEEADGCWPVTFALPNISTEGNSCPGSATQPTSCKVTAGLPHSLFYSFKSTTYVISLFLFSSPKLSCYHWQVFDIALINSYPTTMIAAEMRVTGNWREGVGGGRAVTSVDIALNWIIWWASLGSWAHPHSCFSKEDWLHKGRFNLRPLQVKREIEFEMSIMWYELYKQHCCNLGTLWL